MTDIKVECHHSVEKLLNDVKKIDIIDNPFQSFSFLSVYLKFHPQGDFYFFNILRSEEIVAIIPFECTYECKLFNIKKFRFIGYRNFNYEHYICNGEYTKDIHDVFIDYLNKQKYDVIINFYDINNTSPLYNILNSEDHKKTSLCLYQCPCLHFSPKFEDFYKTVFPSSKKRTELKKFQRKLMELGDFKMINVDCFDGYERNIKYLNQIYRVHSERFANVYATSFFGSEKKRPYYSALIKNLMCSGNGHISMLILDEVVISFIFCLTNGRVLIDWIPAFDPAFAHYSLGTVHYKMLFEEICNQGKYKIFDYSKGSSVYKRKWAKEETNNFQFIINLNTNNPIAVFLYEIDKCFFSFKVYLRKKGVLSWGKRTIGKILAICKYRHTNKSLPKISVVEDSQNYNFEFHYSIINGYPVETRKAVLNAIYQGRKILLVTKDEIVVG